MILAAEPKRCSPSRTATATLLDADFDLLVKDVDASRRFAVGAHAAATTGCASTTARSNIESPTGGHPRPWAQRRFADRRPEFADEFVYAIRLGNGTLSEAIVKINITGAQDNATVAAAPDGRLLRHRGGRRRQRHARAIPVPMVSFVVTDADLGENHFQDARRRAP